MAGNNDNTVYDSQTPQEVQHDGDAKLPRAPQSHIEAKAERLKNLKAAVDTLPDVPVKKR